MQRTPRLRLGSMPGGIGARSLIRDVNHNPRNFLTSIVRDFVATRYRSASAASSPPTPSSSASTLSTSSGRLGSCCNDGKHSINRAHR
jgi:hypothetical protein